MLAPPGKLNKKKPNKQHEPAPDKPAKKQHKSNVLRPKKMSMPAQDVNEKQKINEHLVAQIVQVKHIKTDQAADDLKIDSKKAPDNMTKLIVCYDKKAPSWFPQIGRFYETYIFYRACGRCSTERR